MNFQLCGNLTLSFPSSLFKKDDEKQPKHIKTFLNSLDTKLEKRYLYTHLLNKLVQMTKSEFGFIAKIHDHSLYICAATIIAQNAETASFFYQDFYMKELPEDIFGVINLSERYQIDNHVSYSNIHRMLNVSCSNGKFVVVLYNKTSKYSIEDANNVSQILSALLLY